MCTEGAVAIMARHNGGAKKITDVAPFAKVTHCVPHRENLIMRMMPDDLKDVLDETIKVVNFIKAHRLNVCIFFSNVRRNG